MPPTLPTRLQDLPPPCARLCLQVERFLLRELALDLRGQRLAVAISGGADSTALLLILHCLAPRLGVGLLPLHLNHGLRPEAEEDATACAMLCTALGLDLLRQGADVPRLAAEHGVGLEEAGRLARLAWFAEVRERQGCAWVALGHQLDDLAEDQLLRQLRGTGWPALGGMGALVPELGLLRPLLLTPRTALREFLQALERPWQEDASNQDPAFLRNRVRGELLPWFLRENPAYLETAAGLWRQARRDAEHWERETRRILAELPHDGGAVLLPRPVLEQCPPALRLRVYKVLLDRLGPGQVLASSLEALERAWTQKRGGTVLQFPGGKAVRLQREGLVFSREEGSEG